MSNLIALVASFLLLQVTGMAETENNIRASPSDSSGKLAGPGLRQPAPPRHKTIQLPDRKITRSRLEPKSPSVPLRGSRPVGGSNDADTGRNITQRHTIPAPPGLAIGGSAGG